MTSSHDHTLAFLGNLGTMEILIIAAIILLLFGAKKLPELFRSMGKATREFQKARTEVEGDIRDVMEQEPKIDHQDADDLDAETVSKAEKERS